MCYHCEHPALVFMQTYTVYNKNGIPILFLGIFTEYSYLDLFSFSLISFIFSTPGIFLANTLFPAGK